MLFDIGLVVVAGVQDLFIQQQYGYFFRLCTNKQSSVESRSDTQTHSLYHAC
jgi:hypothetical protein